MGRHAGLGAQGCETGGPVRVRVDQPADGPDEGNTGVRRRGLARPAAAAGAEARTFSRLRSRKERDLTAPRTPTGTRGAAIDPRRMHRIDERAIVAAIARQHDAPAALDGQVGNDSDTAHAWKTSAQPCRDLSGFDTGTRARRRPGSCAATASFSREAGLRSLRSYIQGSSAEGP